MSLLSTVPFSLMNNKIQIRDEHALGLLRSMPSDYSFINFHDVGDIQSHDPKLIQSAFLHVISCTVFDYPNVFNSEKNFKPIVNLRPFVLVSSPGGLKNMQQAGFKTFSDYWSEEYDNMQDTITRMNAVVNIIENICSKSFNELNDMLEDMQDILEYNYNFYYEMFVNKELINFEQQCQRNLGIR